MAARTKPDMTERWELHGEWWLPNSTERSSGILTYDTALGAKLMKVTGPLALATNRATGVGPLIIWGRTGDGNVTLIKSYCEQTCSTIPDADFSVEVVIKGQHLESIDVMQCKTIHVQYVNLNAWIEIYQPEIKAENLADGDGIECFTVRRKWSSHWDTTYNSKQIRLRVGQGLRQSFDKIGYESCCYYPVHDHQFIYETPTTLNEFYQDELLIRSLLDILYGGKIQVKRIHLDEAGDIEVFQNNRFGRNFRRDPQPDAIPIPFSEVKGRCSEIIHTWLSLRDKMQASLSVFLLGLHDPHLNLEYVFLSVMQALEAFHRSFFQGTYLDEARYKEDVLPKLVIAISKGISAVNVEFPDLKIPDDFRSSFKKKLQHSNEVSLRRRLKELLEGLPTDAVFDEARDLDFNSRTVNTRNRYTHVVIGDELVFDSFSRLFHAVLVWQEVMIALMLGKLGFEAATVISAVKTMQDQRPHFFET